jgi:hypothetical protein
MMSYVKNNQMPERRVAMHATHPENPFVSMVKTEYVTSTGSAQMSVYPTASSQNGNVPGVAAGRKRSQVLGYNIVNGGAPLGNNPKFECFESAAMVRKARVP